ncbi:MAG: B12-binding domain-containing radical SAM protein [Thermodesulfobacteriota bacterium]
MKALVINPEPGFCYYSFPQARRMMGKRSLGIPLGLITAAALLPRDWTCRLVDAANEPATENDWDWAELVLLSGNFLHASHQRHLIQEAKRRKKTVVVGGPYATAVPEQALEAGADMVAVGEAEGIVPELLDAIRGGERGRILRSPHRPAMTLSPIPRFDLLDLRRYVYVQIQTSRGCPHDCEFCDIVARYGHAPRYKTPAQILGELETLYRLGWRGHVFVSDDNFIGRKSDALAILQAIREWQKERGEPFTFNTQATIDLGRDNELIDALTRANFGDIFIGVESLDIEALKEARKLQNVATPAAEAVDHMIRNGLSVLLSFIVGFDGEKKGAGERISRFVDERAVPIAMVNTLWAIPNTRLWDRLAKEGRLLDQGLDSYDFIGGQMNFAPSRPAEEVWEEFVDVWDRLFEPSRFLDRAYRCYLKMRPTRRALARAAGMAPAGATGNREEGDPAPRGLRMIGRLGESVRAFGWLAWRMGHRYGCWRQFWRQLAGILLRNPSRVRQYLAACGHGPDLFAIREILLKQKMERESFTSSSLENRRSAPFPPE